MLFPILHHEKREMKRFDGHSGEKRKTGISMSSIAIDRGVCYYKQVFVFLTPGIPFICS